MAFDNKGGVYIPYTWFEVDGKYTATIDRDFANKYKFNHSVVQADSFVELNHELLDMQRFVNEFHLYRSNKYYKHALFLKGNWSKIGGKWFKISRLHFYFRPNSKRNRTKGGFFLPFTNLNIRIGLT